MFARPTKYAPHARFVFNRVHWFRLNKPEVTAFDRAKILPILILIEQMKIRRNGSNSFTCFVVLVRHENYKDEEARMSFFFCFSFVLKLLVRRLWFDLHLSVHLCFSRQSVYIKVNLPWMTDIVTSEKLCLFEYQSHCNEWYTCGHQQMII